MRLIALCIAALLFAAPAWAADAAARDQEKKLAEKKSGHPELGRAGEPQTGPACYMPYSARRDHLVMGCEVPGYRMHYDIAQAWKMFMILLPENVDALEQSPLYFGADTLDFHDLSLQGLFDADLSGLEKNRPGTRVVKKLSHTLPVKDSGNCLGMSLEYPKDKARFPYETYFICEAGSKHYALMLSLSARSQKDMDAAMPAFLKWMDLHTVNDFEIKEMP